MGSNNFRSAFFQDKYPQIPSQKFQQQYWEHLTPNEVSHGTLSKKIEYGHYQSYRHYVTGEEIDKYQIVFANKQQLQLYIESFLWRMHEKYLVNSVYFQENSQQLCTFQRKACVFIHHIPLRLDDITDIPYPFDIALLRGAIVGFQQLYQKVGYFKIREGQVCLDSQGLVKVWINTDLSKNYADNGNFVHIQGTMCQSEMVKQILEIIFVNLDESSQPESLSNFIYSKLKENPTRRFSFDRKISFQEVLELISQYVKKHRTDVPDNFSAIIQLMQQGNYERLLKRQSISFSNHKGTSKCYSVQENKMTTSRSKHSNNKNFNDNKSFNTKDQQGFQQTGDFRRIPKTRYSNESNQSFNRRIFASNSNKSNKSSLKDILSMHFNSKQNSPKFNNISNNLNITSKRSNNAKKSELQLPKLKFEQQQSYQKTFTKDSTRNDTGTQRKGYQIVQNLGNKSRKCNSDRTSSNNVMSYPSSGRQIPIVPVTTKPLTRIINLSRPLMPNPDYTPYPQSVYNPYRQIETPSNSRRSSNQFVQRTPIVNQPLYYQHNTKMPQVINAIPAKIQLFLSTQNHGNQKNRIRVYNQHKNIRIQQNNSLAFGQSRDLQSIPSQVLQASEEKGSSNMDLSSNVDVHFSYANQINEDTQKKQKKQINPMRQSQLNNEIKIQQIDNIKSRSVSNQDQKSLVQQNALKNNSSEQKTINQSNNESRYSHPVTKEDNQKLNTKQSKNKLIYSRLLSHNDSDHIEESSVSNRTSNKASLSQEKSGFKKKQQEIRQSARKQFMAQVNEISQAYKKSFASQQHKKGFEHMMESLLSNYYANQSYVVPQTHYSQKSKIPKKIPGMLLLQNPTIKQVPSKLNLDPEIMRDLNAYESMESL